MLKAISHRRITAVAKELARNMADIQRGTYFKDPDTLSVLHKINQPELTAKFKRYLTKLVEDILKD